MLRGEIYRVDLEPAIDHEADKVRPAIIVSNNAANRRTTALGEGVVTVVPLTSRTEPVFPFHLLVRTRGSGLTRISRAQVEQVRALSVRRVHGRIGRLPDDLAGALDDAIRFHFAL